MSEPTGRRTFLGALGAALAGAPLFVACVGGRRPLAASDVAFFGGTADAAAPTRDDAAVVSDTALADGAGDVIDDVALAADTAGVDSGRPMDPTAVGCEPTRPDAQGPFFRPDAPADRRIAPSDTPGASMRIDGMVVGPECRPVAGAFVEVWHADEAGRYHDDMLRGRLVADSDGRYDFASIVPGRYRQSTGFRPAHIHYKVSAPGFETVTTQIYFAGDPYLSPNDSCGGCGSDDEDRVVDLVDAGGAWSGTVDIVLKRLQ